MIKEIPMDYAAEIRRAATDARQLEALYQTARQTQTAAAFQTAVRACYAEHPEQLLYAAWYYRFEQPEAEAAGERRPVAWRLAAVLGVVNGLILWLLSDPRLHFPVRANTPVLVVLVSPVMGLALMTFIALVARRGYGRLGQLSLGLALLTAYVIGVGWAREPYTTLMVLHLPVLVLGAVGLLVTGLREPASEHFAFLFKCIEAVVTGGVYAIGLGVFATIVQAMFSALNINIPEAMNRLLIVGSLGLVAVVAVASVYDPTLPPGQQDFRRGLSRMVVTLPRVLLPLTLLVLVIYLVMIPFNFMAPFNNREILIVYNGMLFAVMALLLGVTPLRADDLSLRFQTLLRTGIVAVASLVVLVSLYALAAALYRTVTGGLTLNRLVIIGWNGLNIGLLLWLLVTQFRNGRARWVDSLQRLFSLGAAGYLVWTVLVVVVTPWLF